MKFLKTALLVSLTAVSLIACSAVKEKWERMPVVNVSYTQEIQGLMPIEAKYTQMGQFAVVSQTVPSGENYFKEHKIWYPQNINQINGKLPVVVFANGTGVPYYKYEAVFEHLASFGFVVIGNDDKESWSGLSSSQSLAVLDNLNSDKNSIFFNKLDTKNAGISGHSQGGVGAINGATRFANSHQFKAVYTSSATKLALANGLKWDYDISKIRVPYFAVSGTGLFDAGNGKPDSGIAPLSSLQENHHKIPNGQWAVFARRKNTDHGDMLFKADGYMTAWFMYHLKNDVNAGKMLDEIKRNPNWQDVMIKR
ncbi:MULTISPECIES: alpha/beta hydrolase [Moraxella]|uniref:PET hydrolase/cutinase-like domain-containing protein n=1 Tax=Moraxella lacunata TaxID=477 RepID=A0A1B8Q7Z9_MORLA|nr:MULTISPECIES: alpha/beta hydrolase [Moraxella]MBE9579476.1 alpha/beta hydrolase [Moraxella sp. K1664]MBE9588841.1 alpha/beta hydrolase [Moraxella sp. K1630]MBE9589630.1 alpha/beta hydrolase [Moraxella sp. K127]MBE9597053.1 alpha/beta hydrolase [Moraxella sp. K2450]MDH9219631.1 alpha/beta hydrolase [Moraxella lacunata]